MPIYEYEREDGTIFEVMQKISEDALSSCPTTGQKVRRIISQNAFHLKGGGWYKTDYASSGSGSSASNTSTSASDSDSSSASGTESSTTDSSDGDSSSGSCATGCACH